MSDQDTEINPKPEQITARCPYCLKGEVAVVKEACSGQECINASHCLSFSECSHLVFIRCDIKRLDSQGRCDERLPGDDDCWLNEAFDPDGRLFGNDYLRDFLFDRSHWAEPLSPPIASPHAVVLFMTRAIGVEGQERYIALDAEGGAVFAAQPPTFLEELASLEQLG